MPTAPVVEEAKPVSSHFPVQKLPRLVDLGAGKCIPCKMMAPVLEELRNEQSKGAVVLERICGVLVILGGLYMLYTS